MSYKLPTNEHGTSDGQQLTIDIRPLLEDVSQVMTKHISSILSGVVGEYTVYKETHDTIMGLPCVRKLQERISDLENQLNGSGGPVPAASSAASPSSAAVPSVPPAVSELQSAIVELNRYIQVLESRVDVKNVIPPQQAQEQPEEAIRLEVHENDVDADADTDADADDADESETVIPPSVHTNRIVESSSTAVKVDDTEAVAEVEEEDTEEAEADEEDTDAEAAEEEAVAEEEEEEAEEEEEEEEEAEADDVAEDVATDEAAAEEEEEEEEAEEADDVADDVATDEAAAEEEEEEEEEEEDVATAEAAAEEEEEEEIEVSEIKIKGVTYFTTNAQNGIIYACVDDDVGDEVGVFKNGVALFSKNKAATKK
jgi:hypothetical protein